MTTPARPVDRRTVVGGLIFGGPLLLLACSDSADGRSSASESPSEPEPERARISADTLIIPYGDGAQRHGHLDTPTGEPPAAGWPVAVLVHGGFWRGGAVDLMFGLARSLIEDGWATWNIQYSRVGEDGGGWPGTFLDVARAVDHLDSIDDVPLDLDRVALIGHSAGGHLALWVAARAGLPPDAPGADPVVTPATVVALAAVADLLACVRDDLGFGACAQLMGAEPGEDLVRYLLASPSERLPTGVPTLLIHGDQDLVVPLEQSQRFVLRALEAGEEPTLVAMPGADHFAPIMADHAGWKQAREWLRDFRD